MSLGERVRLCSLTCNTLHLHGKMIPVLPLPLHPEGLERKDSLSGTAFDLQTQEEGSEREGHTPSTTQ